MEPVVEHDEVGAAPRLDRAAIAEAEGTRRRRGGGEQRIGDGAPGEVDHVADRGVHRQVAAGERPVGEPDSGLAPGDGGVAEPAGADSLLDSAQYQALLT